ncbi:hypothetical protein KSS87_011839 [Heliosperma pusillum]|nr:hypothetical protein KSS87_011839 [Heliosperma pusillum]
MRPKKNRTKKKVKRRQKKVGLRFTPKWPESNIGAKVAVGTRIIYREHTNSPRVRLGRREANSRGKWTHHRVAVYVSCQKKGEDNAYILTLITLLHRLISGIKHVDQRDRVLSPLLLYSSTKNMSLTIYPSIYDAQKKPWSKAVWEDLKLLKLISKSRPDPRLSKSQELHITSRKMIKLWKSRSTESFPYRDHRTTHSQSHVTEFELVSSHFEATL